MSPQPHGGGGKRPLGGNRMKGKGKGFMGKSFGNGKQSAAGRSAVVKISGQVLTICRVFNTKEGCKRADCRLRMCAVFPERTALPAVASTQLLHIVPIRTEGARFKRRCRPARAISLRWCPPVSPSPGIAEPSAGSTADNVAQAAVAPASVNSASASSEAGPDYAGCLQPLSAHFSFSRQSVRSSVVGERAGYFISRQSVRSSAVGERAGYFNLGAMFGSGEVGLTHLTQTFSVQLHFPDSVSSFLLPPRRLDFDLHRTVGANAGSFRLT